MALQQDQTGLLFIISRPQPGSDRENRLPFQGNDMRTRLVNYRDGEAYLVFPINQPLVSFGREADNMIQLPDAKVSKHHGVLRQTEHGWIIEDLKSRNGILVNGQSMPRAELKDGDRLKIGSYEFCFEMNVSADDHVPSHIIDMSTRIGQQTIIEEKSPGKT